MTCSCDGCTFCSWPPFAVSQHLMVDCQAFLSLADWCWVGAGTLGRLAVGQRCAATPGDILGPYYREAGVQMFPNPMTQSYCLPAQGTKGAEVAITGVLLDEVRPPAPPPCCP